MTRESKKTTAGFRWRLWLGLIVLGVVFVSTAMAGLKVRLFVLSDPQFILSRDHKDALTIQGMNYTSRAKVLRVFAADFGHSVFSIPLAERRRKLLAIDWVEDASVSRIWPDRLVVRIRERTPVAFVSLPSGVLLIDSQGILLDQPAQSQFAFPVLSGVREEEKEEQRRERVRCLARVQEDLGYLAKQVSEVNASDLDNIHIVAQMEHRTVELVMGDNSFGKRFQNFLSHYAEIEKHSPNATKFDLRLDDRITAED
jgi:cell division protein FtsQ